MSRKGNRLYGGEEYFQFPNEVIDKNDAEDATVRVDKTYNLCGKLLAELEKAVKASRPI